ncbi:signal peptidase I [Candidatus Giovannonibacteria bacterium RIFCSPHIGHO2_02_43_13]|uniref:Signal peptidase I n=1 Tax=Candidatus Giovannonibacteria bacterium RIFCSPHIGHO2_02_43_13 TaxID=1798330 RepID=A0A1F5WT63_9BACT|nr:MAG: signal peptidase I [Candidatus Giovannonibacteria bacterium RIFCSPHIGHO2_02_43_13]OGF89273.1 MAG: signal peptidase I [Candidatus Giovannonibacteria bacterium RIFCSPLOWO2_02_FULL_43_54]
MNIMDENEPKQNSVWEFIKVVIISLLIVIPIRTWIAQPFIVEGASMVPNFHDGEYLIIDEISYALNPPKRGEVIIFRYPLNPSEYFIKRIIGLPGETVTIRNGIITIKQQSSDQAFVLGEPYIPNGFRTGPDETVELAADQYFVMGDNREASSDSRVWGPLPKGNITGRVFVRLWPVNRAGFVK